MKKLAVLALGAAVLAGCKQADKPVANVAELELDKRFSYAVGFELGNRFKNDDIAVDSQLFAQAVSEAMAGTESQLSEEQLKETMEAMRDMQMAKAQAKQEEQAKAAEAYLLENAKKDGVTTTESGLQYEVLAAGKGDKPGEADQVKVHYHGTLVDGTVFDSSVERNEPVTFGVTQVIPGWVEALQLMSEGAKYKLTIPSDLAYGPRGTPGIPPNSTLVFEVELLEIVKAEAEEKVAAEG